MYKSDLLRLCSESLVMLKVMLESMGLSVMISWFMIAWLHQGSVLSPLSIIIV